MENDFNEIVNRQRKIKINLENWQKFTDRAMSEIAEAAGKSLTIAFVSDKKMSRLNQMFRGKKSTTDVLSFPSELSKFEFEFADFGFDAEDNSNKEFQIPNFESHYLGDIAISLEQARRQALENNLDFETEVKQLILHGILHLCGYDHETDNGEMNRRELELRDKLDI
jgi:probable rRNA maturation factor